MGPFTPKSKLKYLAHNPTGELVNILTERVKECRLQKTKDNAINSRTNSK
jgi:hypothetical protein